MSRSIIAVVSLLLISSSAWAQGEAVRFRWQTGQVLNYSVRQTTTVSETTLQEMTNKPVTGVTHTKLSLMRRWEVKQVDASGAATLEMSITSMKQEIYRPGAADKEGKPSVDSTIIDSSTPEGQQQLGAFLNKTIVTLTIDSLGQIRDVKTTAGSASRLQAELPFRIMFPEKLPAAGMGWDRPLTIKLDPPLGTGESHEAVQTYAVKSEAAGAALTISVRTALKSSPKDQSEMPPLVPMLWSGEVVFDKVQGRFDSARLTVKQDVINHQGDGTKFGYESEYTETWVK